MLFGSITELLALADISEELNLDQLSLQFNKWAAQVERDFKDFEEKMTIEEINRELENAQKQIVEHFEAVAEHLQQWDIANRKVATVSY